MFGPRLSHVFKSRWHALLWSAGILATAYCSVPTPESGQNQAVDGTRDQAADAAEARQVASALSAITSGK